MVRLDQLNAAAPLARIAPDAMPVTSFYTRSNFEVPDVDLDAWRLTVSGLVRSPLVLSLSDVRSLGERTELVTLECAGNGRILMDPVPDGAPWGLGAVSVAEFTGTPLAGLLRTVGPWDEVVEFVFTGLDRGSVEPDGEINYAFSLEAEPAASDGPLLVWQMNGDPLTPQHGAPLRLLVPGAYGMHSVKWLSGITAIDRPFAGHFRIKYRYLGDPVAAEGEAVGPIRVRSLIVSPSAGDDVAGRTEIGGIAWAAGDEIDSVVVRVDDGGWVEAELTEPLGRFAPTPWSLEVSLPPGDHTIAARAGSAGEMQPLEPIWNENGYGNNVVHRIVIHVVD